MKKKKAKSGRKAKAKRQPAKKKAAKRPKKKAAKKLKLGRRRPSAPPKELIIARPADEEKPRKRALARGRIKKSEFNTIRKQLLEQRQQIVEAMRRSKSIDTTPDVGDEADQAGLSVERELQFELTDNERTTLDQIEGALRKMEKGTFGLCEQCRLPIEKLRIKALPFARYCIQCQSTSERATTTLL
ncbi:TraR/DksA family transcriptional regulator [Elusimicrobiota bacterium]